MGDTFKSFLDSLELGSKLLDGLPFDGMEVSALDHLGKRSVELDYVHHLDKEIQGDEDKWNNDNNTHDALSECVEYLGLNGLSIVKIKIDLRHGPWVSGNWSDGTNCLLPDKRSGILSSNLLDRAILEMEVLWKDLRTKHLVTISEEQNCCIVFFKNTWVILVRRGFNQLLIIDLETIKA